MTMIRDLKFGFRQLSKAPAFTIAAVIVLALGIGVNTAVFTLVNTLFFAPPAYAKPHELVQLFSQDKKDPKKFRGFSYPTYLDIREHNTVFTDVMSFNLTLVGIGQKGDTRRAFSAVVTSNFFSVLGVPLARGRAFLPEEEIPVTTRRSRLPATVTGRNTVSIQTSWALKCSLTGARSRSSELRRRVLWARCKFCHRKFGYR